MIIKMLQLIRKKIMEVKKIWKKNYIIIRQLFGINNYLKMKTINKAYTTNVGKLINLALLNDDDILPEIQEHIDNIQSAIDKFDLQNDH